MVAAADGANEGGIVGVWLLLAFGARDGLALGERVGASDGPREGWRLGACRNENVYLSNRVLPTSMSTSKRKSLRLLTLVGPAVVGCCVVVDCG